MKFSSENNPENQQMREFTRKFFTDNPISFKTLTGGVENQNILITFPGDKKYVMRILGEKHSIFGNRDEASVLFELSFLEELHSKGLPTPGIVKSLQGNLFEKVKIGNEERFCVCFEYLDGETPTEISPKLASSIGSITAHLHQVSSEYKTKIKRKSPGTIIEVTDQKIRDFIASQNTFSSLSDSENKMLSSMIQTYQGLRQTLDLSKLETGIIHGDIKAENIKTRNDICVGLLDFDDCRETYLLEEIANTFILNFQNNLRFLSPDHRNETSYLAEYEKIRPLSPSEKSILSFFLLARSIELILKDLFRTKSPEDRYAVRIHEYFRTIHQFPEVFSGKYLQ